MGQLISGKEYWSDGTPVAGQQFEYAFDDIGNRTSTKAGGDETGASLRSASYSVNNLNQYVDRTVPGAVDVLGAATNNATVAVNGQAAYRKGEYFRGELTLDNSQGAVWAGVTNLAALDSVSATNIGNVFLPQTPEAFSYDPDGNLTNDGRWSYTWDAENRLVAMAASAPVGPQISLKFDYDANGRRIRKQVWPNATWTGNPTNDLRFVYDGWNLIATISPSFSVRHSFAWGLDLSGSEQGAGGVGGLLLLNGLTQGTHLYTYDGNGNVTALFSAADAAATAEYEYGPFGEVIRATGPTAKANPFRFSTKYEDGEADLLYYGYRYYNASMGRWPNRDPLEENGGMNLYGMVGNDQITFADLLGLDILVHATQPKLAPGIISKGLQAGLDGVIWLATPDVAGSGASGSATAHLTYDATLTNVKEIPECVIKEAEKAANKSLKGSGLTGASRSAAWGRLSGDYIAMWTGTQPERIFKMKAPTGAGYWYIFKPGGWAGAKPKLLNTLGFKLPGYLKVGGRVLVAVGVAADAYKIYTADDKPRTITVEIGGWVGAVAGSEAGAILGTEAGAGIGVWAAGAGAAPGAGIGGILGAIIGGVTGYTVGTKATETIYDVVAEGFDY